jgi:hypothetical protein
MAHPEIIGRGYLVRLGSGLGNGKLFFFKNNNFPFPKPLAGIRYNLKYFKPIFRHKNILLFLCPVNSMLKINHQAYIF